MINNLEQTFRWFGPSDAVTLAAIRQTGATGVVTALHHLNPGVVWASNEIRKRNDLIKAGGLRWSVVESVNISESIKTASAGRDEAIENYIQTLKNLAAEDIMTVCYNFMPVLDWTRTELDFRLPNHASALKFDPVALAAFDLFILERPEAFSDFTIQQQKQAGSFFDGISNEQRKVLTNTIMAGLPGTKNVYTIAKFKEHLRKYRDTDALALRTNLAYFLQAIIPDAEKLGVKMCIHPDDPPFSILGLPRIVSTEKDLEFIVNCAPSPSNGLTFCTGSLGARAENELPDMITRLGTHIHFLHLRNVKREVDGCFYEADHLGGSTDMYAVMKALIREQQKRVAQGRVDIAIPMRPDHGHKILDDFNYDTYPGYSVTGRMKGLAELRGLELGIKRSLFA